MDNKNTVLVSNVSQRNIIHFFRKIIAKGNVFIIKQC